MVVNDRCVPSRRKMVNRMQWAMKAGKIRNAGNKHASVVAE